MTRRSLLRRTLLTPWINLVGLIGCASPRAPAGRPPSVEADPKPASRSDLLSPDEMDDLVALGEVLVESRTLAPAERRHLVEHIQDRTRRGAEYLETYRTTASTLDHLADGRFASLDMHERTALIVRYRLVAPQAGAKSPAAFSPELQAVLTRAVKDLIGGYYGSPAGWATVGYDTFPGRCGDLMRYTRPEG